MHITHGRSKTPTHRSWAHMLERCRNPKCRQYKWYGAKGVVVCERWALFENFLADMGERPASTTLDRITSSKGYEPNNCRWADSKVQQRNRSNVRLSPALVALVRARHVPRVITYQMLANEFGVSYGTIESVVKGRTWV